MTNGWKCEVWHGDTSITKCRFSIGWKLLYNDAERDCCKSLLRTSLPLFLIPLTLFLKSFMFVIYIMKLILHFDWFQLWSIRGQMTTAFNSSLTALGFLWTKQNALICKTTNEFASFCIDKILHQNGYFHRFWNELMRCTIESLC